MGIKANWTMWKKKTLNAKMDQEKLSKWKHDTKKKIQKKDRHCLINLWDNTTLIYVKLGSQKDRMQNGVEKLYMLTVQNPVGEI